MTTITISKKITNEIKAFVIQIVSETLNDPDFGLELSEKAKKRLSQELTSRKKTIPFSEIKRKYC